jgi:hypothetical protein
MSSTGSWKQMPKLKMSVMINERYFDRAVFDGDPQLANEVVLLGPPYARREVF